MQYRLAKTELINHRVQTIGAARKTAVGYVVPIPRSIRVKRIEVRQIELGYSSGASVHHHPSGTLPLPFRFEFSVFRQCIIQAISAARNKNTVGHIVNIAGNEFPDPAIDIQGADLHIFNPIVLWSNEELYAHPLTKIDYVLPGRSPSQVWQERRQQNEPIKRGQFDEHRLPVA